MVEMILAGIAAACLLASLHFGTQYYPPGYGYDEERHNRRVSTILGLTGIGFIAASILAAFA